MSITRGRLHDYGRVLVAQCEAAPPLPGETLLFAWAAMVTASGTAVAAGLAIIPVVMRRPRTGRRRKEAFLAVGVALIVTPLLGLGLVITAAHLHATYALAPPSGAACFGWA